MSMKIQPVQPVSNCDFDGEQLFDTATGKTVCDLDSPSFQEALKEAVRDADPDLRTHSSL